MEMDDMKLAWQTVNARLEHTEALVLDLRRDSRLRSSCSALTWFRNLPLTELVFGLVLAVFYGSWFADGPRDLPFLLSLTVLFLLNLVGIVSAAWQLGKLSRIDYDGPVLGLQRELAKIRTVREFTTRWGLILALLIWVPMAVVIARVWFHFDLVAKFGLPWVLVNLGLGAIAIPLIIWLSRRLGPRLAKNSGVQRMMDDLAGRSLVRAIKGLAEITEFDG